MRVAVHLRSSRTLVTAGLLASTGSAVLGARSLLTGQAEQARTVIPKAWDTPPRADGVYAPGSGPVHRWERGMPFDVHLMVFGDSTATGYGCTDPDEVPGVLLARRLAEQSGKLVRLSTKAIVGATSKGLAGQVDAMLVAGPPPDAAVIMVGANDVTVLNGIGGSARRLGAAVARLRRVGAAVAVGTCPDFGVISAIPQPLRWTARSMGLRLARAQAVAVSAAGGVAVPLADLLTPHFRTDPARLFAHDGYHPSAAGYELVASQLLPALCRALGAIGGDEIPELSWAALPAARPWQSRLASMTRWPGRRTTGVPAPVVASSG
ncbi:MAG: SGNH/GDSL hydrolase family protein [Mycobacterium sp.]